MLSGVLIFVEVKIKRGITKGLCDNFFITGVKQTATSTVEEQFREIYNDAVYIVEYGL